MSTSFFAFAVVLLIAVLAAVAFVAVPKIRQFLIGQLEPFRVKMSEIKTEISEIKAEVGAVRQNQEAAKVMAAWDASPLSELQFSEAQTVALLSSGAIDLKWTRADLEGMIERGRPADADEIVGLLLEFVAEALRKTPEAPSVPVVIRFAGTVCPLSEVHITIGQNSLTSGYAKLWDAFSKLPELTLASLMVVAHYFHGLETARRLSEINRKVDDLHVQRRMEQRADVEAIWVHAAGIVRTCRPTEENLTLLMVWCSQLYKLRRVWQQEVLRILQTTPVAPRWEMNRDRWSDRFFRHVQVCIELVCLMQLSLFTEYCIALAARSTARFQHTLGQEEPRVAEMLAAFRRHETTLSGTRMLGHIRDIGNVLEAYKNVLHGLTDTDFTTRKLNS